MDELQRFLWIVIVWPLLLTRPHKGTPYHFGLQTEAVHPAVSGRSTGICWELEKLNWGKFLDEAVLVIESMIVYLFYLTLVCQTSFSHCWTVSEDHSVILVILRPSIYCMFDNSLTLFLFVFFLKLHLFEVFKFKYVMLNKLQKKDAITFFLFWNNSHFFHLGARSFGISKLITRNSFKKCQSLAVLRIL